MSVLIAKRDMAVALLVCGGEKRPSVKYLLEDLPVSGVFFLYIF